mmetsp:Transcript_25166/g.49101  ORF Transcript_25166/g.49101 Transcript_25166/m.49101 type:complete len:351 (+) Transcript_25166:70-1122(+)
MVFSSSSLSEGCFSHLHELLLKSALHYAALLLDGPRRVAVQVIQAFEIRWPRQLAGVVAGALSLEATAEDAEKRTGHQGSPEGAGSGGHGAAHVVRNGRASEGDLGQLRELGELQAETLLLELRLFLGPPEQLGEGEAKRPRRLRGGSGWGSPLHSEGRLGYLGCRRRCGGLCQFLHRCCRWSGLFNLLGSRGSRGGSLGSNLLLLHRSRRRRRLRSGLRGCGLRGRGSSDLFPGVDYLLLNLRGGLRCGYRLRRGRSCWCLSGVLLPAGNHALEAPDALAGQAVVLLSPRGGLVVLAITLERCRQPLVRLPVASHPGLLGTPEPVVRHGEVVHGYARLNERVAEPCVFG